MKNANLTAGDKEILTNLVDHKGRVAIRSLSDGKVYMAGFITMNTRMGDAIRASIPGGMTPEDVDAYLTLNGGRPAVAATVDGIKGLYDII